MAVFYLSTNLLINELVVEADLCRILSVVGIIDSVEVRPIDGTQAHRTRFARGINLAPLQVECLQGTSCLTNGIHLGMGGRVVVDGDAIGSLSHDDSVLGDDCPERTTSILHTILGERNGSTHQFFFCHISFSFLLVKRITYLIVKRFFIPHINKGGLQNYEKELKAQVFQEKKYTPPTFPPHFLSLIIHNYKYLYYKNIYNFSIFVPHIIIQ